jgi:hypothetical protein
VGKVRPLVFFSTESLTKFFNEKMLLKMLKNRRKIGFVEKEEVN